MDTDIIKYVSSSTATAIVTKTAVSPITRIKVLQQIESYHKCTNYINFNTSVRYIYKHEGIRGFYKGNLTNIYKSIPNYCLKFPLNDLYLNNVIKTKNYKSIKELPFNELLKAGIFTGTIQTSVTYPVDLIRTRITQDVSMFKQNNGIISCFTETVRKDGFLSLYRGFTPAILTSPVYIGLQLSIFQNLKNRDDILSNNIFAAGTAGTVAQLIMYPGDTVKRHMQIDGINSNQYTNLRSCVTDIYKKNGIAGFYRGILLNSIKTIPEIIIKFSVYNYVKDLFIA